MSKVPKLIAKNIFTVFINNMKIVTATKPNVISVITSSIQNSARLPLSRIKGTEFERKQTAQHYSDLLRQTLDKVSTGKTCKFEVFKSIINGILSPDKIHLDIKPQKKNFSFFGVTYGSLTRIYSIKEYSRLTGNTRTDFHNNSLYGYVMSLPMDDSQKIITDKYVALHEARHLFDSVCNPKMIVERDLKVSQNKEKEKANNNAYKTFLKDDCLPFMEFFIKLKAQKYLSKLSDEECIDCLQEIRNSIKTEINAYRDTLIYLYKGSSSLLDIINMEFTCFVLNYPKKLEIANQMLAEKIAEVRNKMHHKKMF